MKIAVFRTSNKENEKRVPIYPEHLWFLPAKIKSFLYFEKGYGEDFGYADKELESLSFSFLDRDELFQKCDILILPKPTTDDLLKMHSKQILWGWAHCVQQNDITQIAIDKKLTIISWESMFLWEHDEKDLHIFYKNNEIAGYAAVIHALGILGIDGHYGTRKKVTVISYGSVSRGAIYALQGRGFNNIHVFTRRKANLVEAQNPDVYHYSLFQENNVFFSAPVVGNRRKFIEEICESEIIINGILQDPIHPSIFVRNEQLKSMKRNSLIIDISCDRGMGFEFAVPTSFDKPIINLPNNVHYYSVDHTPSYLWDAASREISKALIPCLINLFEMDFEYHKDTTLLNAIEIENGLIINQNIIAFQRRQSQYPYSYYNT